jgi:16S rRNA (cytidine1402-2'-O)-methyltransferase
LPGTLYLVATPLGNLEDMSPRAVRVLGEVDVIAAEDTRSAERLLGHFGQRRRDVRSFFAGNEAARTEELLAVLAVDKSVAVISEAGLPGVSDPGERLVRAAIAAAVRVEVIPGPVAALTALVASGLPCAPFTFLGFPPREAGARRALLGSLAATTHTLIFYEAPGRVATTLGDLAEALGGDRLASLARELTKVHEEHVRGTLTELAHRYREAPPRGECTLVVAGAQDQAAPLADPGDLERAMCALLDQGLGPRDAAARLVARTGKPRRQLYQLALSLRRGRDGAGQ